MMARFAPDGRLRFVTALALSLSLALPGCASSGGVEGEGEGEPQTVSDESVEEATAGGPVRLNSGSVTGTAHALGGGYIFVGEQDLDADCDARGHIRRVTLAGNARTAGDEFLTVTGAVSDIDVVGDQVYYSVITGCGLAGGYLARRPVAGGAETVLMRVGASPEASGINGVYEFAVRGDTVYALVQQEGHTTIRSMPLAGGRQTVVADFSTLADAENFGFTNLQADASAVYVHEENTSSLWRIPVGYRGTLAQLPAFPNARLPVGDYLLANDKVYFVAGDRGDRVMVTSSATPTTPSTIVWPGAAVRSISDLAADAGNVYFFGELDRAIYRYDLAARRVVRLARSLTVDSAAEENNLSTDGTNLYWMQLLERTNREAGIAPMRLAKTWLPR